MEQEPKLRLNLFAANRQRAEGQRVLKSLGIKRWSQAAEQDTATAKVAQRKIELGRIGIGVHFLIHVCIISGGMMLLEKVQKDKIAAQQEKTREAKKQIVDPRTAGRKAEEDILEIMDVDSQNANLRLAQSEISWKTIMKNWVMLTPETGGGKELHELYDFFWQHGKAKVHYKEGNRPPGAAPDGPLDFRYRVLEEEKNPYNPNHAWYQRHGITYYDPAQNMLYLSNQIPEPEKLDVSDKASLLMHTVPIWFALWDAMSHLITGGATAIEESAIAKTLVVTIGGIGENTRAIAAVSAAVYAEDASTKTALEIPLILALKHVEKYARENKDKPGYNAWSNDGLVAKVTYQFVRFLLANDEQAIAPLKPALREILAHPEMISQAIREKRNEK